LASRLRRASSRAWGEVRRRTSALGASFKRARALPSCRQAAKRTLASRKGRWSLTGEGGKAGAFLLGEGVLGQEFLEALFRVDL
jgi:hypothetical protein